MHNGGAGCVVAMWRNLRGDFNALLHVTLGFPVVFFFQFSMLSFLNFLPPLSSSLLTFLFALCFSSCHYYSCAAIIAVNLYVLLSLSSAFEVWPLPCATFLFLF